MTVNFSPQEVQVIHQLSQFMDIPPEKVVIQALRLFQMHKMGHVRLLFPPIQLDARYTTEDDFVGEPQNLSEETALTLLEGS